MVTNTLKKTLKFLCVKMFVKYVRLYKRAKRNYKYKLLYRNENGKGI